LLSTSAAPPLDAWIGTPPQNITAADEEDLNPIGGVDEEEGKTMEDEMTILGDVKRQDLATRFKKTADGVYVEAKRSAIGGVAQVPLYFYGLLLALGWNEIVAGKKHIALLQYSRSPLLTSLTLVLRNPLYFVFLILMGVGAYVTYTLNLWGPILRMTNAASSQGLDIFKEKLRDFLETTDTGRQAVGMSAKGSYR
jgi:hypothetical protein